MSLGFMKKLKTDFVDELIDREEAQDLGNSARLLLSWIEAVLEFTVLKHEALYLTVKKTTVLNKIQDISTKWPIKKQFIESAYKLLLFTKRVKPEINLAVDCLKSAGETDFLNFKLTMEKIIEIESKKVKQALEITA